MAASGLGAVEVLGSTERTLTRAAAHSLAEAASWSEEGVPPWSGDAGAELFRQPATETEAPGHGGPPNGSPDSSATDQPGTLHRPNILAAERASEASSEAEGNPCTGDVAEGTAPPAGAPWSADPRAFAATPSLLLPGQGPRIVAVGVACAATGSGHRDRAPCWLGLVDCRGQPLLDAKLRVDPLQSPLTELTGVTAAELAQGLDRDEARRQVRARLGPDCLLVLAGGLGQQGCQALGLEAGVDFCGFVDLAEEFRAWSDRFGSWTYFGLTEAGFALLGEPPLKQRSPVQEAQVAMRLYLSWVAVGRAAEAGVRLAQMRTAELLPRQHRPSQVDGVCCSQYNPRQCICGQPTASVNPVGRRVPAGDKTKPCKYVVNNLRCPMEGRDCEYSHEPQLCAQYRSRKCPFGTKCKQDVCMYGRGHSAATKKPKAKRKSDPRRDEALLLPPGPPRRVERLAPGAWVPGVPVALPDLGPPPAPDAPFDIRVPPPPGLAPPRPERDDARCAPERNETSFAPRPERDGAHFAPQLLCNERPQPDEFVVPKVLAVLQEAQGGDVAGGVPSPPSALAPTADVELKPRAEAATPTAASARAEGAKWRPSLFGGR